MYKRYLVLASLPLTLAACGSSKTPSAATKVPAVPAQAATAHAVAPATAPATSTTAPATSPAVPSAPASTNTNSGMNAAAHAAMVKDAKNFVDNGQWVEGKNYFLIQPQQPKVSNTDKVEVVEVFNYGCPACNVAHQFIDKMKAELPPYAHMSYLAAGFRPDENWVLYQRTYYTARALGLADKAYDAMFDANWKTGVTGSYNLATGRLNPRAKWPDIHTVATFFHKTYGIPAQEFVAVANSFAINTQIKRADKLVKDYQVGGTPTIVVDGKYRFDFRSAGTYGKGIELAKWLVAKEAANRVAAGK